MTITEALQVLDSATIIRLMISGRSALASRKGRGWNIHVSRVRRRRGEAFERMLIRLAESLLLAPPEHEAERRRAAERIRRSGGKAFLSAELKARHLPLSGRPN